MTTTNTALQHARHYSPEVSRAYTNAPTMADLINSFAAYIDVKEVTAKSYGVALRAFLDWTNDNGVYQPQREDILAYKAYLASPHPKRARCDRPDSKPGAVITYSAGTQARYLRAVKALFKWTSQQKPPYYYPNVADGVKGAKVHQGNYYRDPLTREENMAVLEAIDRSTLAGKRDYAMILLASDDAFRIIELQRANVGNIETKGGTPVLYVQGKRHDEADTPKKIPTRAYAAIVEYLEARGSLEDSAPLFAGAGNRSRGQRLTEPSISRIIKERFKAAGIDSRRKTAHSLRHSSVTNLLLTGATIQQAQYHARHSNPETTGGYAHNIDMMKANYEQRVEDYLFGVEQDTLQQITEVMGRMTEDKQKIALQMLQAMAA